MPNTLDDVVSKTKGVVGQAMMNKLGKIFN